MKLRKSLLALLAGSLLSFSAVASDDGWVLVSVTDSDEFSAKKGTYDINKNNSGDYVSSVVGKISDMVNKKETIQYWYIRTDECQRGYGKLVSVDLDGSFLFENDWAEGGKSASSQISGLICGLQKVVEDKVRSEKEKGFSL